MSNNVAKFNSLNGSDTLASSLESGRSSKRVVVTTETTVRRQSLNDSSFHYEEDPWEKNPKTDYTYSKTASYMKHSPTKGYKSPNMSRRSLRGVDMFEESSHVCNTQSWLSTTTMESGSESVGQFSMVVHGRPSESNLQSANMRERSERNQNVTSGRRRTFHGTASHNTHADEEKYNQNIYDASLTRSGTQYSVAQRLANLKKSQFNDTSIPGSVTRNISFSDIDEADYSQYEMSRKQSEKILEYAGESIPYKEAQTPIPHLYGLDVEMDESDTEEDLHSPRIAPIYYITTFFTTAIKSFSRTVYKTAKVSAKSLLAFFMYISVVSVYILSQCWSLVSSAATLTSHSVHGLWERIYHLCCYTASSLKSAVKSSAYYTVCTLTSPITFLALKVRLWRTIKHNTSVHESQVHISEATSSSGSKVTRRKTRLSEAQNKSSDESKYTNSSHFDETSVDQMDLHVTTNHQNYETNQRLGLADSVAKYALGFLSLLYVYTFYPVYYFTSLLCHTVYHMATWIAVTSSSSVIKVCSNVSALWRGSSKQHSSISSSTVYQDDIKSQTLTRDISNSSKVKYGKSHVERNHQRDESYTNESTERQNKYIWVNALTTIPSRLYGFISWFLQIPFYLCYGCVSGLKWIFVDVMANSIRSTMSSITENIKSHWTSESSGVTYNGASTSNSKFSGESSTRRVTRSAGESGTGRVTKRSIASRKKNVTFSSDISTSNDEYNHQDDGRIISHVNASATGVYKEGWNDCLCSALMFIPLLLYELLCAIGRLVKYIYFGSKSVFVDHIGAWSYSAWNGTTDKLQSLLSYMILTDVWILSRSRRCGLCCLLPLVFLLPILLCGGYYVYDQGSDAMIADIPGVSILGGSTIEKINEGDVGGDKSSHGMWWSPWLLFGALFGDSSSSNKTVETPPVEENQKVIVEDSSKRDGATFGGVYLNDKDLQAKIRETFIVMYSEAEAKKAAAKEKDNGAAQQVLIQQVFNQYKVDVESMTRHIVKEELSAFMSGYEDQKRKDSTEHTNLAHNNFEQATKLKGMQDQMTGILAQTEQLSAKIVAAQEKMKFQGEADRKETLAMIDKLQKHMDHLQSDIEALQKTQALYAAQLKDCCKNDSTLALLIRSGVKEQLSLFQHDFAKQDDIDTKIAALVAKLSDRIKSESESAAAAAIAASVAAAGLASEKEQTNDTKATFITVGNETKLSEEQVRLMIRDALNVFGADKTGMVDYALESAGGSVISTRCSETYHRRTAQLSLFGIPLWYNNNSPRTVIQPEVHPGQCWPFSGSHGYVVIQLAGIIVPTAFSLEHIPKTLSPTGQIDSAPKDFSVKGLEHERDTEGHHLGNFMYDQDGEPLQYFTVNDPEKRGFGVVELMIESNWGNEEYTCLYRFRVHGHLKKWMGDE